MWHTWLKIKTYRFLEGKRKGKRPLGITRRKYKNSIQIKLQGVGGLQLNSHGSWRAALNKVVNIRVP
jgi:hypothetical protein